MQGAASALVCFDLSDLSTLQKCQAISPAHFVGCTRVTVHQFWVGELKKYEPNCRIALIGCKSDLAAKPSQAKPSPGAGDAVGSSSVSMKYFASPEVRAKSLLMMFVCFCCRDVESYAQQISAPIVLTSAKVPVLLLVTTDFFALFAQMLRFHVKNTFFDSRCAQSGVNVEEAFCAALR